MKKIFLLVLMLACASFAGKFYVRADGSATKANAVGPATDATKCMTITTLNGATFSAGDTVVVSHRGGVHVTKMTFPSSGSDGNPIVIMGEDPSNKPTISGASAPGAWSAYGSGLGSTWQASLSSSPTGVFVDSLYAVKGASATTLKNHEWFWVSSVLYYRNDEGDPTGKVFDCAVRDCFQTNSKTDLVIKNIAFIYGYNYVFRAATLTDSMVVDGCDFIKSGYGISFEAATNTVISRCVIDNSGYGWTNRVVYVQGASSVKMLFCRVSRCLNGSGIEATGTSNIKIYNTTISGLGNNAISCGTTDSVILRNCIVSGFGYKQASDPFTRSSGVLLVENTQFYGSPLDPSSTTYTNVTFGNGNKYLAPIYKKDNKVGILSVGIDDFVNSSDLPPVLKMGQVAKHWSDSFTTYYSLSNTNKMSAQDSIDIRSYVTAGHSLGSHTRDHANLSETRAFTIQYVGSGSACSYSKSGTTLTTSVTGAPSDNLNIDLTNTLYNSNSKLIAYIDGLAGYTCTIYSSYNHAIPPKLLRDTTVSNIKVASYVPAFDTVLYYSYEIDSAKADIENFVGGGYKCLAFNLPLGNRNAYSDSVVFRAGHKMARTVTKNVGYKTDSLSLFYLNGGGGITFGIKASLPFDNSANDVTSNSLHFTSSGLTYSNSIYAYGTHSAYFDGSSAYAYRANNSKFSMNFGDWAVGFFVRPAALVSDRTIYYNGSDANNYFKICLKADSSVNVKCVNSGVEIYSVSTPHGSIINGDWNRVVVSQYCDTVMIRYGSGTTYPALTVLTKVYSNKYPLAYTGIHYIGCGYDFGGTARNEFFNGYLDNFFITTCTYGAAQAVADWTSQNGCWIVGFSHGETQNPTDLQYIVFEAYKKFGGRAKAWNQNTAYNWLRANGTMSSDSLTLYVRQRDSADYRLSTRSPVKMIGDTVFLRGTPNLYDLDGHQITDASGNIVGWNKKVNYGAHNNFANQMSFIGGGAKTPASASIAVPCSLAGDFWRTDSVAKDSAKLYLHVSTNKLTWTLKDSSASLIKAGQTATLTASGLAPSTKYYLRASAISSPATLYTGDTSSIDSATTQSNAPSISDQPDNASVCIGALASFSVTATGTGTLAYQWWRKRSGDSTTVGSNSSSYSTGTWADGDSVWVVITDDIGSTMSTRVKITAIAAPAFSYATNPASYTVGVEITSNTVSSTGGAIDSFTGTVSAGLSLNKTTGAITGTPTTEATATTYTITAHNCSGTATVNLQITVACGSFGAISYASNPATATQGTAHSNAFSLASGSIDSVTLASALPAGLSLTKTGGSIGNITGTPTTETASNGYKIYAWKCGSKKDSLTLTLTVNPSKPGPLSYAASPAVCSVGVRAVSYALTNGGGRFDSATISPTLSRGLSISKTSGTISGLPLDSLVQTDFKVKAYNVTGVDSCTFRLTVSKVLWVTHAGGKSILGYHFKTPICTLTTVSKAITFASVSDTALTTDSTLIPGLYRLRNSLGEMTTFTIADQNQRQGAYRVPAYRAAAYRNDAYKRGAYR